MFNDRRLYSPAPTLNMPQTRSKLPAKICLISAAVLAFALIAFIWYTGLAILYIHYWVYIAAAALIVLLLLGAGAFAIHSRIQADSKRRIVGILLMGIMALLLTVCVAFVSAFANVQKPAAFYDSPEGENRVVVMLTDDIDGVLVTAYPAIGNHFYVAALESEIVLSNGVIYGVEWEGERLAKVKMEDSDGNDTELVVDFAPLYGGEAAAE